VAECKKYGACKFATPAAQAESRRRNWGFRELNRNRHKFFFDYKFEWVSNFVKRATKLPVLIVSSDQ